MKSPLPIAVLLLLGGWCAGAQAREQKYSIQLTDYALLRTFLSDKINQIQQDSLAQGLSQLMGGRLSPEKVLSFLKSVGDYEVSGRWRPNWRRDGDRERKESGLYSVRFYIWEQIRILAGLDWTINFIEEGGARTTVESNLNLDVRKLGKAFGDPRIFALANLPRIHRFVNNKAEQLVQLAERQALYAFALSQKQDRQKVHDLRRYYKGFDVKEVPGPVELRAYPRGRTDGWYAWTGGKWEWRKTR